MKNSETDTRITPLSKLDAHIHYVIAFIGGFLGTYSVYTVAEEFGSAQTMNLMLMVHAAVDAKWILASGLFLGAACYALGVFLATVLTTRTKLNVKFISLALDLLFGLSVQFMPEELPPLVYVYPAFFVMSFQYCSFSGSYGYAAATIFSSNNFRQTVSAMTEYFLNKKKEFKLKFQFYGATLLSFYTGSGIAFFLFLRAGTKIFSLVIIPVFIACVMILKRQKLNEALK